MFSRKSCPRCKGDVRVDRDQYGWYEQCLMCGYMRDLESIVMTQQHHHRQKKKLSHTR